MMNNTTRDLVTDSVWVVQPDLPRWVRGGITKQSQKFPIMLDPHLFEFQTFLKNVDPPTPHCKFRFFKMENIWTAADLLYETSKKSYMQ